MEQDAKKRKRKAEKGQLVLIDRVVGLSISCAGSLFDDGEWRARRS